MFDIAPSEFLLVAFIALVVIGPKDLPKALRVLGYWVGRARAVGRQFRAGFDEMVREAELAEMEQKWKEENERIMREHPAVRSDQEALPAPVADAAVPDTADTAVEHHAAEQPVVDHPVEQAAADPPHGDEQPPVMVEQPTVSPSPEPATPEPVTPEPATPEPATDVAAPLPAHAPGELDRRRKPSQADLFKRPGDEPAEHSAESKAAS